MATYWALSTVWDKYILFQSRWNNSVHVQAGRKSPCKDNGRCVLWCNDHTIAHDCCWGHQGGSCRGEQGSRVSPRQTSSGTFRCLGKCGCFLGLVPDAESWSFLPDYGVIAIYGSANAFTSLNICSCWLHLLESASTSSKVAHEAEPIQIQEAALIAHCHHCSGCNVFSVRLHIAAASSCRDVKC